MDLRVGTVATHLSDEGQLQGDIEDNLGVIGCQFQGSAGGSESKVSYYQLSSMPACAGYCGQYPQVQMAADGSHR